jgi:hypothetical protein
MWQLLDQVEVLQQRAALARRQGVLVVSTTGTPEAVVIGASVGKAG